VVLPLLGAPLCLLLRSARLAWSLALLCALGCLGITAALLVQVHTGGAIIYTFGGWAAPLGIEYQLDAVNAPMLVLIAFIAVVVLVYARRSIHHELDGTELPLFYVAYLLNLAGLLGVASSADIFNIFVFTEIASLSAYLLTAMGRDRRALLAAFRYLMLGSLGATFLLIGIAFLYAMTGTLNLADLRVRLDPVGDTRTVAMAYTFITLGLGIKFALFPLHLWLPAAYGYAPSAVAALMSATATKVFLLVWLRLGFITFGVDQLFGVFHLDLVLIALAVAAILAGSLMALFQQDVKRLLAYSSVAQIGYIVLGACLATATGLSAALLHVFSHALVKCALFLAVGCLVLRLGSSELSRLAGAGRRMPWTAAALVAGALGLIGMPMTTGFVSKWYLIQAALAAGQWWLALPVMAGSLLAVAYLWRVVEVVCLRPAPAADATTAAGGGEAPLGMLLPIGLLLLAMVWFGIDASLPTALAEQGAAWLLGADR